MAQFRGLPVTDANDGAQVVCFRSYIPSCGNQSLVMRAFRTDLARLDMEMLDESHN